MVFRERDPRTGEEIVIINRREQRYTPPSQSVSRSNVPSWKHGPNRDTNIQPTPTPSPSKRPTPDTYTKQQIQAHNALQWGRGIQQNAMTQSLLAQRRQNIDPEQQYVMQTQGSTPYGPVHAWSKGQILTGKQLQDIYTGQIQDVGHGYLSYQRQQQDVTKTIDEYHPNTTFQKTLFMNRDPKKDVVGFVASFPWEGAEHYGSLKKQLDKEGFLGLFRTSFSARDPLGLYSAGYTATGEKQKALDVKLQALHQFNVIKKKGPLSWEYAGYLAESPYSQLLVSYGAGKLVGKGLGYISKVLSPGKSLAVNIGVGVAGGAMTIPAASSIWSKYESGRTPEALADISLFMGNIYAGYKGFKPGYAKGQQYGFRARWTKDLGKMYTEGKITPSEYNAQMYLIRNKPAIYKALSEMRISRQNLRFEDVSTLQRVDTKGYMEEYFRVALPESRGTIVHGSVSRGLKTRFGDIDIMASPREKLNLEYAAKRTLNTWEEINFNKNLKSFSDVGHVHRIPRPGSIVTEQGGFALRYEKTPSGIRITQMLDEFTRLSDQAIKPQHMGRVRVGKDITESVSILKRFSTENYISPEMQNRFTKFTDAMDVLQQHYLRYAEQGKVSPFVTTESEGAGLYGKSFTERFYNLRYSFAKKTTSFKKLDVTFRKRYDPQNLRSVMRSDIKIVPDKQLLTGAAAQVDLIQHRFNIRKYFIYDIEPKIRIAESTMFSSPDDIPGGYSVLSRMLMTKPIQTKSFGTIYPYEYLGPINRMNPQFHFTPEFALAHEFRHVIHPKSTTMFGEFFNYRITDIIPNQRLLGMAESRLYPIATKFYQGYTDFYLPTPVRPTYSQYYGGIATPLAVSSFYGGYEKPSFFPVQPYSPHKRIKPIITNQNYIFPSYTPVTKRYTTPYKQPYTTSQRYPTTKPYVIPAISGAVKQARPSPYKPYKYSYPTVTPMTYKLPGYMKMMRGPYGLEGEEKEYLSRYKFREFKIPELKL